MGSPEQLTTQQIRTQAWLQSLSQPPVLTLQHLQVMGGTDLPEPMPTCPS